MFLQTAHNPSPSANFPVQAFKDVVRPYAVIIPAYFEPPVRC